MTRDNGPIPRNSISAFGISAPGVAVTIGVRFKGTVGVAVSTSEGVGGVGKLVAGAEVGGGEVGEMAAGALVAACVGAASAVRKIAVGR